MSRRSAAWLAWALCGIVTSLAVGLFGIRLLGSDGQDNVFRIADDALFSLAMPVVTAIVAALIVSRQPRNVVGWLMMVIVASSLVGLPIVTYIERLAPSLTAPTPLLVFAVWFSSWSWVLLIYPLLLIVLLFPNGRPPTARWRWVGMAAIAWAAIFVTLVTISQPLMAGTTPELVLDNPIGILGQETAQPLFNTWIAGSAVLIVLCVASLFVRYRRAGHTEREQIKWLLYACAVFLAVDVGGWLGGLTDTRSIASDIWSVFFGLSVVAFPAAIGVAILRYHLYEIDLIIRRTLVYGLLTAMLALFYFGGVALLQSLSRSLTGGQAQQPQWAIVASTLAIAALFQPLRHRIQRFIDRRFYRRKYDAAKTLET
ncbi:MAG: hypothetical protein H0V86_12310, partial [Chloroflexia bacterium]|nr:hypothetical protein [Chloroflexia bacterium]